MECLERLSLAQPAVNLIADDMNQEIIAMEEKGLFSNE
jgi:hypothetical protein